MYDPKYSVPFDAEIISWVVIQQGSTSVTSGELVPFEIGQAVRGNLAFFPKPTDPLTNNLFRGAQFSELYIDREDHFAKHLNNVAHLPEARMTPEMHRAIQSVVQYSRNGTIQQGKLDLVQGHIWDAVKSIASKAWDGKAEILNLFKTAAKVAAMFMSNNG